MATTDITMLGSGLASTATLIELFDKLLNGTPDTKKISIVVIEKNTEFWLGLPYGSRSSVNALSITTAHEFIYENERSAFFEWLVATKDEWSAWYRERGGATAARWLHDNMALVEKKEWGTIYIPRFLFGKYMLEKLNNLRKSVEEKQLAEITAIQAEAIDVKIMDGGLHKIIFERPDGSVSDIVSRKVVIATGSVPVRRMDANISDGLVYINDIYEPSVSHNIEQLYRALKNIKEADNRNVLVIGSNASAIELLYLLEGLEHIRKLIHKIILISPSGLLPYHISTEDLAEHPTPSLDQLENAGSYTLETIIEATYSDLKLAVQNGANVAYIATVITKTLQLVDVLGEEAKKVFIGTYGMKLSGMFRRAGHEYKNCAQLLLDLGEATLLKGRFISTTPSDNGVKLNYIDTTTGQQLTYPLYFNVMVNCTGSDNLDQTPSRLISNLVLNHIGKMNLSGKGFEVNENFEISPNLYVMGPLLGGNMNKLIHFWHLENAPRILYLAPYLADILLHH